MTTVSCRLASGEACCCNSVCHEQRKSLQNDLGLTGTKCWAYDMVLKRRPDLLPRVEVDVEREAIQSEGL